MSNKQKSMKRILLFLVISLVCLNTVKAKVTWSYEDGTLTISGTGAMDKYYSEYSVPWLKYSDDIKRVIISNGVESVAPYSFSGCHSLSSVEIPNSVTDIGDYAFFGCYSLRTISLPSSLVYIRWGAFCDCSGLISVFIPKSVAAVYPQAFAGCNSMSEMKVENGNEAYFSSNNCIIRKRDDVLVSGCHNSIIPEGVKKIGPYSFAYLKNITSINIPEGVEIIDECAFEECDLTSINIPNTLKSIGSYAFYGCEKLTYVTIPNSVLDIKGSAFYGCKDLKNVIINVNSQLYLFMDIFRNSGLETLEMRGETLPSFAYEDSDDRIYNQATLIVPVELYGQYRSTRPWTNYKNITARIADGTPYTVDTKYENVNILYNRTFNNAQWQPLYIPFSMDYTEWKDDYDVATINNFHEYYDADGNIEKRELEIRKVKNCGLLPNHPYLIRSKTTGSKELSVENATLASAEENSISCSSVETRYTFTGTYQSVTNMKTNGCVFLSNGKLCTAANDDVELKSQRWYLTMEKLGSQVVDYFSVDDLVKTMSVRLIDDAGESATGIEEIRVISTPSSSSKSNTVYDLSGRRQQSVGKGVNIVRNKDGKVTKVLVK